ncbi:hypothetical protein M218_13290 [Burkholderia pseudomallei MSHR338]|nr:hypothetical protein M218_13290 [Burkholderia pseudomallei MSHR338]
MLSLPCLEWGETAGAAAAEGKVVATRAAVLRGSAAVQRRREDIGETVSSG